MPLLGRRDRQPPVYRQAPVWAGDLTAAQAIVWFQVRDDGHLAGLHLERASGWDAVDAGIQRAVLRADSNRLLQPLPRALRGQPIDLWFAVGFGKPEGNLSLPVARVRMRGPLAARTWPRLLSVGHEIRFPDAAIRAGIGDTLVMEFVVDTTGLAIPETIAPVRASFRDFAEEAARSIRSSRFAPGRIGTCAVPMRFRMATRFFFIGGP